MRKNRTPGSVRGASGNWRPYRDGPATPPAREETAACPQQCAFLYVNPGLGTLGLPLRLGMPPEITVLTLRAAG